ncbi:predicted protein [Uncinocarpus reesii 1704]|uniref:SPT2 chromatin protein n=1 Tax=Uncinocarpus reesii (strain UAMH 1704) TaxID=336963 RepID=C4JIG0_UNCRE|nr:uncharacterized protein UREG_01497 [Uncinocarpus reesii 1704]EEP76648.1 predicted protein [Uncinocarpus reesii 1704]
MSFLNSVLTSIGTGDASIIPPSTHRQSASAPIPPITTKAPTIRNNNALSLGQKRKADDNVLRPTKVTRITKPSSVSATPQSRPSTPQAPVRTSSASKPATSLTPKSTPPHKSLNTTSSKPPVKGSYADIMAQAKALQQQKPLNVGLIRHQTVAKERMSKAKRERLLKEAKQRELEASKGKKPNMSGGSPALASRFKADRLHLRKSSSEPDYKGTARPSTTPSYTGTSGLPSRRGTKIIEKGSQGKPPRPRIRDEYLGTDEEDEGEDYYDDYSDASSDMEAGVMDVEEEEQAALRLARVEDERELKAEMEAKKAKLERKKKLAALSKSRR